MISFRCSAILFDLDGVLIDSTRSVERQWRRWAQEKGIDEEKVVAIAHGVRSLEVIRAVAPHIDAEAEVRRLEEREAGDQVDVNVMPGAVEFARALPEGRWGVVTSGTRDLASARLRLGGFVVPKVLVTADDVTHGKPHPEPYLKGAELLGVRPQQCVVIEDAPAGIRAARDAGMKVIGFASTYQPERLREADTVVSSFTQLSVTLEESSLLVTVKEISVPKTIPLTVQVASTSDMPAMLLLINSAFSIETFLAGDRTDESGLAEMMNKGKFLLGCSDSGRLIASVYVEIRKERGYFGMLAVEPAYQHKGVGRFMVYAAEDYCRKQGCRSMDLTVLSLRPELPPLYRKLGYRENGTEEFRTSRPLKKGLECHCIVMSKRL